MAKKDKASGTRRQAPGLAPESAPAAIDAAPDALASEETSQLGQSDSDATAETQAEREARERAEKRAALEREAAAKEEAAQIKRERLADEAAEEKARMREAEKANSIAAPASTPAAPENLASDVDPFTVPIGTLTDHELTEQWDALQSVEADLQEENAAREEVLKEHARIKEELRIQAHEIEKHWYVYQHRVNHVLLPRRTEIANEVNKRREKAAQEAAAAQAAEEAGKAQAAASQL